MKIIVFMEKDIYCLKGSIVVLFIKRVEVLPDLESYVMDLPVIQSISRSGGLDFTKDVTFLVGENGSGKSTLLEGIGVAYGFNPEGGTLNFNFKTRDTHSELHDYLFMERERHKPRDGFFLRAESFYNMVSYIDEVGVGKHYGGKSLHEQSHGESFMSLMKHRFSGDGLYLLDEPEAALSPMSLMSLLVLIQELVETGSQFIIATHSPILMAFPKACIYEFSEGGVAAVALEETEHYQITKSFLADPARMLHYLLGESGER